MVNWSPLLVVLAAVNLVRLTRRVRLVVASTMTALIVLALTTRFGMDAGWLAGAGMVILGGVVTLAWGGWCLDGRRGRLALGLMTAAGGLGGMGLMVWPDEPADAPLAVWGVALLLLGEPTTRMLRWALGLVGKTVLAGPDALGRGEAIGILERWIALVMIVRGDYTALGFVLAAKALARHKRFEDDPAFAEYFLVGTLASVLAAIVVAEALRWVLAETAG